MTIKQFPIKRCRSHKIPFILAFSSAVLQSRFLSYVQRIERDDHFYNDWVILHSK